MNQWTNDRSPLIPPQVQAMQQLRSPARRLVMPPAIMLAGKLAQALAYPTLAVPREDRRLVAIVDD